MFSKNNLGNYFLIGECFMYDGLALCLTAFDVVPPKKRKNFGAINCVRHNFFAAKKRKFYFEKWPVINNLNGYLYHFFAASGDFSDYQCCDDMFEFLYSREHPAQSFYPGWLGEENSAEDCCTIKVKPEYREDFAAFLLWLLQSSPIKQILFLCVGEMWPAPRTPIIGTLPFRSFSEQIASVGVLSDVCYYICL